MVKKIKGFEPIFRETTDGSIIAIVGTDAPLVASKLNLVAKRVTLGLALTGSVGNSSSGDIFIGLYDC